jgi:hypothetical protein
MMMREGDRWICSNPACRCEIEVVTAAKSADGTNPNCCCGSRMRKAYHAPSFRRIRNQDDLEVLQQRFSSGVI